MKPLDLLVSLPWSWVGPAKVDDGDGPFFEVRVAELPDFFVACQSEEEVKAEAPVALRAFLRSYLDRNEIPPLPEQRWVVIQRSLGVARVERTANALNRNMYAAQVG